MGSWKKITPPSSSAHISAWKKAGVEENYNNTKAKYKLVMKSPEFLEHVKETEEWDGR